MSDRPKVYRAYEDFERDEIARLVHFHFGDEPEIPPLPEEEEPYPVATALVPPAPRDACKG